MDTDPIVAAGFGSDIPALPTRGGYHANEVYGELSVPVLKDTPGFKALDLSFAARYSDYSTSGTVYTWKIGGTWETPLDGVRLRAVTSNDVRAPNLPGHGGRTLPEALTVETTARDLVEYVGATVVPLNTEDLH